MATIKELRRAKGWSQFTLAAEAGVSPGTISVIERCGECLFSTKKLIAGALGVSPDEISVTVVNRVLKRGA